MSAAVHVTSAPAGPWVSLDVVTLLAVTLPVLAVVAWLLVELIDLVIDDLEAAAGGDT